MREKNGLSVLAIFLIGGVVFRYGVDILDIISQHIGNIFTYKSSSIASKIEDIKMDTHKKWAVVTMEFPMNGVELADNVIGFSTGYDDFEEDDYDDE